MKAIRGNTCFPVLILEARGGIEPPIKVLQTFALPLTHRAPVRSTLPQELQS